MRFAKAAPLIGGAALLILAIAVVVATRPPQPAVASGPDPRLAGEWLLSAARDDGGALELGDTYVTLTIRPALGANGRGPCNNYSATIVGAPGPVYVTLVRRQFEQCPILAHWKLDKRYAAALKAATFASVTSTHLKLSSPHTSLTFRRAPSYPTFAIEGVVWQADYQNFEATDGTSVTAPAAGSLVFAADQSFLLREQGCPTVTGRWSENAGELVVDHLKHETADCGALGDFRDRDYLLKAMKPGFQFIFSTYGNTLTVLEPKSGSAWQFEAAE